jgi:hypothetical protein
MPRGFCADIVPAAAARVIGFEFNRRRFSLGKPELAGLQQVFA